MKSLSSFRCNARAMALVTEKAFRGHFRWMRALSSREEGKARYVLAAANNLDFRLTKIGSAAWILAAKYYLSCASKMPKQKAYERYARSGYVPSLDRTRCFAKTIAADDARTTSSAHWTRFQSRSATRHPLRNKSHAVEYIAPAASCASLSPEASGSWAGDIEHAWKETSYNTDRFGVANGI